MWESRYASEEVLDEEGLIEIFKYITKNSVKEGLVDHSSQWKGLHGYHQFVAGETLSGHWFDRTGYYRAQQRRNLSKRSSEAISIMSLSGAFSRRLQRFARCLSWVYSRSRSGSHLEGYR